MPFCGVTSDQIDCLSIFFLLHRKLTLTPYNQFSKRTEDFWRLSFIWALNSLNTATPCFGYDELSAQASRKEWKQLIYSLCHRWHITGGFLETHRLFPFTGPPPVFHFMDPERWEKTGLLRFLSVKSPTKCSFLVNTTVAGYQHFNAVSYQMWGMVLICCGSESAPLGPLANLFSIFKLGLLAH